MLPSTRVFLSAEWRDLVMLNYVVDSDLLSQYVPSGTALDSFEGRTYLSLVGFRFLNTRLLGHVAIPFHANFDEINLRFYVRRRCGSEDRRGVVFVAEVVPRCAIATTARLLYGENYRCFPMRHSIQTKGIGKTMEYEWRVGGEWCKLHAQTAGRPVPPQDGSLEQFITEHYWGYSAQRNGGCLEYRVAHEPWQVWAASEAGFEGDASDLYGSKLGVVLRRVPDCAFVACGSPVNVFKGDRVE
jgi:uncharacterized protein YqjF (DUF2071 family)